MLVQHDEQPATQAVENPFRSVSLQALGQRSLIRPLHPEDDYTAVLLEADDLLRPPWRLLQAQGVDVLATGAVWATVLAQLAILDLSSMRAVAVVTAGNPNLRTRTARMWLTATRDATPEVLREGTALALGYFFSNWDLFKIHGEGGHDDVDRFRAMGSPCDLLRVEGVLTDFEVRDDGGYRDLVLAAITQEDWSVFAADYFPALRAALAGAR